MKQSILQALSRLSPEQLYEAMVIEPLVISAKEKVLMETTDIIGGRRFCYFINETQDVEEYGGYVPSIVVEDKPGHYPMLGQGDCAAPWVWGKDLAKAEAIAAEHNQRLGLSAHDVAVIIASSMRGAASVR